MDVGANLVLAPTLRSVQAEIGRRRCRTFHGFVKEFFDVVEPSSPFVDNWHIHTVCEHLEACAKREIRQLIINIPPRTMKSIATAVMFLPWVWGALARPQERFLYASYSAGLSARDSRHCRKVLDSHRYREYFGHIFAIGSECKSVESFFENDRAGSRMATSVGGTLTGEGANFRISDDPLKADEAQSETVRNSVIEWDKQVFSTRLCDPATDVEILVMQRLHEADLTGYKLAEIGGYEHLCIPMEWDKVRRKTILGSYDPRTKGKELLWPERFPEVEVKKLKRALGEYGASGQLQQLPSPAEGGILAVNKIRLWPSEKKLPSFSLIVQSWDTSFTEKTQNDPSAMLALGVFEHKNKTRVMILDAFSDCLKYPELRKRAALEFKSVYGEDEGEHHRVDYVLIEDKGSGISLRQDLQNAGLPCRSYNPGKSDKIVRAHRISPLIEAGLLYIPESSLNEGKSVDWAVSAVHEFKMFPNGKHDDSVDCLTQALIYLQDSGIISIDLVEEEEFADDRKRKIRNPYAT